MKRETIFVLAFFIFIFGLFFADCAAFEQAKYDISFQPATMSFEWNTRAKMLQDATDDSNDHESFSKAKALCANAGEVEIASYNAASTNCYYTCMKKLTL